MYTTTGEYLRIYDLDEEYLYCRRLVTEVFSTLDIGLPYLQWGALGVFRKAQGPEVIHLRVRRSDVAGKIVETDNFYTLLPMEWIAHTVK